MIKKFYGELSRRNVVRVATIYLIAGWLSIQIIDVAFPLLKVPEWAGSMVLILLLIGFPFALIFAWAFELTPEGLKREEDVDRSQSITPRTGRRIDFVIIGLLLIAVIYFFLEPRMSKGPAEPGEETPAIVDVSPAKSAAISVAVLPFVNMSNDEDNEYFSDGISEELLNVLVRIKGLRVPSRTSSFAFKGRNMDIAEIASALDVEHILEGSVRKAGDRVRITAQLIDVSTDTHLWSETFDRNLEDIFAVQDEIAQKIVRAIQETLSIGDVGDAAAAVADNRPPSGSVEAYELYLQGRHFLYQRGDDLENALSRFKEVVEADPEYAAAWSGLAATYIVYPDYLVMDRARAVNNARDAAEKSLELKPGQAEPYAVLGLVAAQEHRWEDSFEFFDRAINLNPGEPSAYLWKGIQLIVVGYFEQAEGVLRKAVELAPGTGVNNSWFAYVLLLEGEIKEAERYAIRAQKLGHIFANVPLAQIYELRGELELAALAVDNWHRSAKIEPFKSAKLAYAARGDARLESEIIAWASKSRGSSGAMFPIHTFAIIQSPVSIEVLRSQLAASPSMLANYWLPSWSYLRNLPETHEIWREEKIVEFWEKNGWPRWCKPSGVDIVCE